MDASITLAWVLDDRVPTYAVRVRQALTVPSVRAIVPAIWHLEIANVLAVAERRKILSADDISFALAQVEEFAAKAIESHNDFISARRALNTARTFQLSAYDSVYLDAALTRRLPLATLDKSLRSAAARAGVQLFN